MAYSLIFPFQQNPVFHTSLLKLHKGDTLPNTTILLPTNLVDSHPVLRPISISNRRSPWTEGSTKEQLLIKLENTSSEEATWEDRNDLPDKSLSKTGRMLRNWLHRAHNNLESPQTTQDKELTLHLEDTRMRSLRSSTH